jgi:hypothetical protein
MERVTASLTDQEVQAVLEWVEALDPAIAEDAPLWRLLAWRIALGRSGSTLWRFLGSVPTRIDSPRDDADPAETDTIH